MTQSLASKYSDEELRKFIDKAKFSLIRQNNSNFICTVLFSLKQSWNMNTPTAAVNGVDLKINPDWFGDLSEDERVGLLAHEAWHIAFDHIGRSASYGDKNKYNKAADHVINLMLDKQGIKLPKGGLKDPKYADKCTEEVYRLLPEDPETPGGTGLDIETPSADQIDQVNQQVKDILVKAATQSKMMGDAPGTIPGDVQIAIDELVNPKLDWRIILQNYVDTLAKNDYSFSRPNKRYMPDFYLPSLTGEKLGEVCVAVDTSGSVTDDQFVSFLSEIQEIREKLNPELTRVIDFDTSIKAVHELDQFDDISKVNFTGRGGTNLQPVFDYYDKTEPVVLIVFSDLYCTPITEKPNYPVIWIVVDNPKAETHFGTVIHYSTEDL